LVPVKDLQTPDPWQTGSIEYERTWENKMANADVRQSLSSRTDPGAVLAVLAAYGPVVALAVLVGIMSLMSPEFLTTNNLMNVVRQVSISAIVACGVTFVIITAGIDLSVGSMLALVGCAAMLAMEAFGLDMTGILIGILVGAACGAANGIAVAWLRMPPFIATLAGLTIYRGLALILTGGQPVIRFEGSFQFIGQGVVWGVPIPILILLVVAVSSHVVLTRTAFGAHVYAVGGNEEAARLSGINVARTKFLAYVITGALVGLAGMILTARLSSAQPNTGEMFELDVIAAVVIGGTSLMGGRGSIVGTMMGALIIGVLNNGFNLMAVDTHVQLVAKGAIIILAVLLDQYLKGNRARA
jgi:ribose transport system permease protein